MLKPWEIRERCAIQQGIGELVGSSRLELHVAMMSRKRSPEHLEAMQSAIYILENVISLSLLGAMILL